MGNDCCGGKKSSLPASKSGEGGPARKGLHPVTDMTEKERLKARDQLEEERKKKVMEELKQKGGFISYGDAPPIQVAPTAFEITVMSSATRPRPPTPPSKDPEAVVPSANPPSPSNRAALYSDPEEDGENPPVLVEESRASPVAGSEARVEEIVVDFKPSPKLPEGKVLARTPPPPPPPIDTPNNQFDEHDIESISKDVDAPSPLMARVLQEKTSSRNHSPLSRPRHSAFSEDNNTNGNDEAEEGKKASEFVEEQEESIVVLDSEVNSRHQVEQPAAAAAAAGEQEEEEEKEQVVEEQQRDPRYGNDEAEEVQAPHSVVDDDEEDAAGGRSASQHVGNVPKSPERNDNTNEENKNEEGNDMNTDEDHPFSQPLYTEERHQMTVEGQQADTDDQSIMSSHRNQYTTDASGGVEEATLSPPGPRRPPPPVPVLSDDDDDEANPPAEEAAAGPAELVFVANPSASEYESQAKERLSDHPVPDEDAYFGNHSQTEYQT